MLCLDFDYREVAENRQSIMGSLSGEPLILNAMKIPLSQGQFAILDDADFSLIAQFKWYAQRHRHTFYAISSVRIAGKKTTIKMHRVLLGAMPGQEVDHDDGDGLNNRRHNIKIATRAANQQNQHAIRSVTGAMGVYPTRSGKFQAQLKRNGRSIGLGTFASIAGASAVRDEMAAI
jgi:hypothetical protein